MGDVVCFGFQMLRVYEASLKGIDECVHVSGGKQFL